MRQFLVCAIVILLQQGLAAQDWGLYWKYKDYDGAISFALPRWVIHTGSWFLDEKPDRKLLRKVKKVRVLVFEDDPSPVTDQDLNRFSRKAKRRGLEYMLSVRDGKTRVEIWAKERRNKLRKIVVLAREPDSFALVSLRTRLSVDEIGKFLKGVTKNKNQGGSEEQQQLIPQQVRSAIRI